MDNVKISKYERHIPPKKSLNSYGKIKSFICQK